MRQLPALSKTCLAVLAAALLMPISVSSDSKQQPKELGTVRWMRDFDKAQATAATKGQPMLVLFQEVPG